MSISTVRLSSEFRTFSGGTPSTKDSSLYAGDIPFIRSTEINQGKITCTKYFLTEAGVNGSSAKIVWPGTLLLAIYGATSGLPAITNIKGAINQAVLALIPKKEYSSYLLGQWLSLNRERLVYSYTQGGQPNLSGEIVKSFQLPVLPTQRRIAAILQTWDRAIALAERQLQLIQDRKRGLMQLLLTGEKRLPGFEGEWEEVRLGEIFSERKEIRRPHLQLLSVGSNGVYPQNQGNKRDTSNSDKSKYKRIAVGDIGYNTMRMWQGRSAYSDVEGIISPAYTVIVAKQSHNSRFWSRVFQLPYLVHRFWRNSQGLVDDTLNCKFNDLRIVRAASPPTFKEENALDRFFHEIDEQVKLLRRRLETLKKQKKGLMQRLLNDPQPLGPEFDKFVEANPSS